MIFDNNFLDLFKKSLDTGYIDKQIESEVAYQPKLLINKKHPRQKVLPALIQEFSDCKEFKISVAFVTTSGVAVLFNSLLEMEKKGIKGKVLVSQYLNFTQPEALIKLSKFTNIELRISTKGNTHSKGYIFKKSNYYNVIVGSSNLTASALTINKEWNLKVSGLENSYIVNKLNDEFNSDFKEADIVTDKFISEYQESYSYTKLLNTNEKYVQNENIVPNRMQQQALLNLSELRNNNKHKALIISATGTGKTFLSAFDVRAFNAKKLLFVVHRLNIAKKALETFSRVIKNKKFGIYSGDKKELNADYIFSTVQTISKENHLLKFTKDYFDYIIIDETHRSSASSYLRLLNYFEPEFLLGMTATPERTDGTDIFSLFNHNIAYEIRLNKAMDEEMLVPFHYYGISDLMVNGELFKDTKVFNRLNIAERVNRIIEKARLYGTYNGITRGLVFCSRNNEAEALAEEFNQRGIKSISLSGESTENERIDAIQRLETDDMNRKIEYIFTVDIFNEGIDIPNVNQILMIRPTESAIIFVQQLGRGLRKVDGKDYLTVVDFIGNHKNNYLIPIALYGDTSFNKDTLRKLISEGSKMIPGSSTINFDQISKEKIFKSIDSANMKLWRDLKKDYDLLKYRIGRIPMMKDFLEHESRDPFLFVEYSKSYYNFVIKAEKGDFPLLNQQEIEFLELFSKEINNAKRAEECFILNMLLKKGNVPVNIFRSEFNLKYGYKPNNETIESCILNINFAFIRKKKNVVLFENGNFKFHQSFKGYLNNLIFKKFLLDSVEYSLAEFDVKYNHDNYRNGLLLYNKYGRKDVCRLLNWTNDISSTIYGYRTKEETTPCFVTYHKSNNIEDSIKYNDHFINNSVFAWESRSNRKIESKEIQNVIKSRRILLFVKKEDAEGTDFYYMGDCSILPNSIEQSTMKDTNIPVVHFKFKLYEPVIEDLYKYITSKEVEVVVDEDLKLKTEIQTKKAVEVFTIPLYDFYAAAGSFSEIQFEKSYELIEVEEKYTINNDFFACRVIGNSMNRRIPNGSICIFKKYTGGSRSGKIFLIENYDNQDFDFKSAFTIKTYTSEKIITKDGWRHKRIVLKPNSFDPSYKEIIINTENAEHMKIIGEFISVL